MPQMVLQLGKWFAEEGTVFWMVRPSPGGHEKVVPEAVAMFDLETEDILHYLGLFGEGHTLDESVALPVERRRPDGKRGKKEEPKADASGVRDPLL